MSLNLLTVIIGCHYIICIITARGWNVRRVRSDLLSAYIVHFFLTWADVVSTFQLIRL